jgi:antitoxin component of RelBE/YafQ-DinJ toxin-antitoxin module
MKTAGLNVKVDDQVKKQAQAVAASFGIPLSTLVNAYLVELGQTRQVHFSAVEIMTPEIEKIVETAQKEIEAGETVGPFKTTSEAVSFLKKL